MNLLNACGPLRLVAGDDVSRSVTVGTSTTLLVTLGRVSRRSKRVILGAVGPILALVTVGIVGIVVGDVFVLAGGAFALSRPLGGGPLYQSRTNVTTVEAPSSKLAIEF
jgi:hypothetical protein